MRKILLPLLLCLVVSPALFSQSGDSIPKAKSHYTLALGTGWSHYFANMDIVPADKVHKDFVDLSFRFLWEPEYRLSLGLETGFYRVFKVDSVLSQEYTMHSRMNMMPLLLVVRMRIIDHFYLSAAPGIVVQFSKVEGIGEATSSTQFSLANFEACASYLYPLGKSFFTGGEARFLYVGVTNDYLISLNAVFGVKF